MIYAMKRIINCIIILIVVAFHAEACTNFNEDDGIYDFKLDVTDLFFDSDGGSQSFTITSNNPWDIPYTFDGMWISLDIDDSQYYNFKWTIKVNVNENDGEERWSVITIRASLNVYSVKVTQSGKLGS